jgi:hypothetical protein
VALHFQDFRVNLPDHAGDYRISFSLFRSSTVHLASFSIIDFSVFGANVSPEPLESNSDAASIGVANKSDASRFHGRKQNCRGQEPKSVRAPSCQGVARNQSPCSERDGYAGLNGYLDFASRRFRQPLIVLHHTLHDQADDLFYVPQRLFTRVTPRGGAFFMERRAGSVSAVFVRFHNNVESVGSHWTVTASLF